MNNQRYTTRYRLTATACSDGCSVLDTVRRCPDVAVRHALLQATLLRACTGDDGAEEVGPIDRAGWMQRLQYEEAVMHATAGAQT